MTNAVRNLTLAWFFSGKEDYAEKATGDCSWNLNCNLAASGSCKTC
ncbi:MAG: hypothetical protein ACOC1J_02965 [Prolixibacteraceae bacterium]